MSKPTAPIRKSLEQLINAGKTIEGVEGYVTSKVECCGGPTTIYIPVKLVGVEVKDCAMSAKAVLRGKENINVDVDAAFSVNPRNFFLSKQEINEYRDYLDNLHNYNQALKPFNSYSSSTREKREAFDKLIQSSKHMAGFKKIMAEIKREAEEDNLTVGKLPVATVSKYAYRLALLNYFPQLLASDTDPNDLDEE